MVSVRCIWNFTFKHLSAQATFQSSFCAQTGTTWIFSNKNLCTKIYPYLYTLKTNVIQKNITVLVKVEELEHIKIAEIKFWKRLFSFTNGD